MVLLRGVHCCSSVLPFNMKGVPALHVPLSLTMLRNKYLVICGPAFHHTFRHTALKSMHSGDSDVQSLNLKHHIVVVSQYCNALNICMIFRKVN